MLKNPPFLGILGQNAPFWTFFSRLQALTNFKVSEKCNERFSRNCVTDGRDSLGLKRLRRETKKSDNSAGEQIGEEKWEKPHF